jgi:hypothetical protein
MQCCSPICKMEMVRLLLPWRPESSVAPSQDSHARRKAKLNERGRGAPSVGSSIQYHLNVLLVTVRTRSQPPFSSPFCLFLLCLLLHIVPSIVTSLRKNYQTVNSSKASLSFHNINQSHYQDHHQHTMHYFLLLPIVALMVLTDSLAIVNAPNSIARVDIAFPCPCIDHWFKHERNWIRASSTDGCMALETNLTVIWALNKLPKPAFVSKNYPNLACSLLKQGCQWNYSPLDQVTVPSQSSVDHSTDVSAATSDMENPSQGMSKSVQQRCEILPERV